MEKRRIQRIGGILVVISLVIIILPLLFGENSTPVQAKNLAPLPGDTKNIPSDFSTADLNTPGTVSSQIADEGFNPKDFDLPMSDKQAIAENNQNKSVIVNQQPVRSDKPVTAAIHPQWVNKPTGAPPMANVEAVAQQPIAAKPHPIKPVIATVKPKPVAVKHLAIKNIKKFAPAHPAPQAKLANAGWVIQMGSFKSKTNAQQLTDKLRAAGFKAFTSDVKSTHGTRTRVFVGPEFKRSLAAQLSNKVHQQLNMQGYVTQYNPLDL